MDIPSYFLSPEWAIVATQLLAGFVVLTIVLGWVLWRRHRQLAMSARQLIRDRSAIRQAGERVLDRQLERHRPGCALSREARAAYADRSLVMLEPLVGAWLEPKRHDLSDVMRRLLEIRQEDLHQLLVEGPDAGADLHTTREQAGERRD